MPELTFAKGHRQAGHPRCLAWRPAKGRQCGLTAKQLKGGGTRPHPAAPDTHMSVCWRDGGDSLRGQAHPKYDKGKWSAFVPEPLLPTFTKALESGDLLSGMRTLGLMAAREETLLKRLSTGETSKTWDALQQEWTGLRKALEEEDTPTLNRHMTAIQMLLSRGKADAEAWVELFDLWERQRKTADTEIKRREKAQLLIPAEIAMRQMDIQGDIVRDSARQNPELFAGPQQMNKYLRIVIEGYSEWLGSRAPRPRLTGE